MSGSLSGSAVPWFSSKIDYSVTPSRPATPVHIQRKAYNGRLDLARCHDLSIPKMSSSFRGSANACLIGLDLLGNRCDFLWKREKRSTGGQSKYNSAAIQCLRVIGVVSCDWNILTPDWAAGRTASKPRAPIIVAFPGPKDPDRVFRRHSPCVC